jgi:hypothetical protein
MFRLIPLQRIGRLAAVTAVATLALTFGAVVALADAPTAPSATRSPSVAASLAALPPLGPHAKTKPPVRWLASTSALCGAPYSTSLLAARWPGNGSRWYEMQCVREDQTIPGNLWWDDDFYYWSGTKWIQYGTWFDHETMPNSFTIVIDYCYWVGVGQQPLGPFHYDECPVR